MLVLDKGETKCWNPGITVTFDFQSLKCYIAGNFSYCSLARAENFNDSGKCCMGHERSSISCMIQTP